MVTRKHKLPPTLATQGRIQREQERRDARDAKRALTKSLASNLLDKGIRVNAVAPGPVRTPLNPADAPADKVARFGRKTDMRRAAQPEELAPAYVFLALPVCAGCISGVVLPITGSVGAL